MSNLKAAVGEKEAAAIKKRLVAWAKAANPACADCGRPNPTWASVNLGVLVCLECAGKHRALGTHISKMRSITLDTILPAEARFLLAMSNDVANSWWEARLEEASTARAQPTFIRFKYNDQRWALQSASVPAPSVETVPGSHPWWQGSAERASEAASQPPAPQAAGTAGPPARPAPAAPALTASALAPDDLIDLLSLEPANGSAAASAPAAADPFAVPVAPPLQSCAALGRALSQSAGPAAPTPASCSAVVEPSHLQAAADPFAAYGSWAAGGAPAASSGHQAEAVHESASMPSLGAQPPGASHTPGAEPGLARGGGAPAAQQTAEQRAQAKAALHDRILSLYGAATPSAAAPANAGPGRWGGGRSSHARSHSTPGQPYQPP